MRPDNELERQRSFYKAIEDMRKRHESLKDEWEKFVTPKDNVLNDHAAALEILKFINGFQQQADEAIGALEAFAGAEPPEWTEEALRIAHKDGKLQAAKFVRGYVGSLTLAKQWLDHNTKHR